MKEENQNVKYGWDIMLAHGKNHSISSNLYIRHHLVPQHKMLYYIKRNHCMSQNL